MSNKYKVAPVDGASSFEITRGDLRSINEDQMTKENKENLAKMGGVDAVVSKLKSSAENGLDMSDAGARAAFGTMCILSPLPRLGLDYLLVHSTTPL